LQQDPRVTHYPLIVDYDDIHPPRSARLRRVVGVAVGVLVALLAGGGWLLRPSPVASPTPPAPPAPPVLGDAPSPGPVNPARPAPTALPVSHPARAPRAVPQDALLSVNAVPWGAVALDGREVGFTPTVNLPIAPGGHRLRVTRPGYRPFERKIEATPGERLRISGITLEPEESR